MSIKRALFNFVVVFLLAVICNVSILLFNGSEKALEFLGGYIIELSLSVDNLFLFILVFSSFGIKKEHQKRILNYGIFGAIVLRLIFVLLGVAVVNQFKWIIYVFGILLIISGIKMFLNKEEEISFENNKMLNLLKKFIPITNELHKEKFFVKIDNVLHATPLFAVLFLIEFSDIIFAIDSIPAIFAITTDPFIVYSSNILAILGLRSLYFLLEHLHHKFRYVKYGVGLILVYTGFKLGLSFIYHIPIITSICTIVFILICSIIFSIYMNHKQELNVKNVVQK